MQGGNDINLFLQRPICNTTYDMLDNTIHDTIRDVDISLLVKASEILTNETKASPDVNRSCSRLYAVMDFLNKQIPQEQSTRMLVDFWKADFSMDHISNYRILPINTSSDCYMESGFLDNNRRIFLDAPTGLALEYDKYPIAIVTYMPKDDSLMIQQMQGIRRSGKHTRELMPLQWKELFLHMSEHVARNSGFERIGIRSALNNPWLGADASGYVHLPLEEGLKKYDDFAHANGFARSSDNDWYRKLDF